MHHYHKTMHHSDCAVFFRVSFSENATFNFPSKFLLGWGGGEQKVIIGVYFVAEIRCVSCDFGTIICIFHTILFCIVHIPLLT